MSRRRSTSFTTPYAAREAILALSEPEARVVLRIANSLSGIRGHLGALPTASRKTTTSSTSGRARSRTSRAPSTGTAGNGDEPVLMRYSGAMYLGVNIIEVRESDLKTLQEGSMLNDVAVDVSLRMWWADMTAQCARYVHVFPSYFFEKLRCQGAEAVRKWLPRDLFDKKYIFIPVNEREPEPHWYLTVVVLRPTLYIFTLDTLGRPNRHVPPYIHNFLILAAAGSDYVVSPLEDDTHKIVKVPKQIGSIDCGVYLIHLARTILNDPSQWVKTVLRRAGDITIWGSIHPSDLRLELGARLESLL